MYNQQSKEHPGHWRMKADHLKIFKSSDSNVDLCGVPPSTRSTSQVTFTCYYCDSTGKNALSLYFYLWHYLVCSVINKSSKVFLVQNRQYGLHGNKSYQTSEELAQPPTKSLTHFRLMFPFYTPENVFRGYRKGALA